MHACATNHMIKNLQQKLLQSQHKIKNYIDLNHTEECKFQISKEALAAMGRSNIPHARAAAQTSRRLPCLRYVFSTMILSENKHFKHVCLGSQKFLGPPLLATDGKGRGRLGKKFHSCTPRPPPPLSASCDDLNGDSPWGEWVLTWR